MLDLIGSSLTVFVFLALLVIFVLFKTALVVPNQQAVVVERLGKFHAVLFAGFHILIPFIDAVAYRRSLKEDVLDVPKQTCITKDNVSVDIDGVLYLQVVNPEKSAYGISDYMFGSVQLAQTALRSAIGKLELDRTFEERSTINQEVISALDAATAPWGIKVLRYEIRDITPPSGVMQAMEKQMRAEREKRALIAQSEGEMQAAVPEHERLKKYCIGEGRENVSGEKGSPHTLSPPFPKPVSAEPFPPFLKGFCVSRIPVRSAPQSGLFGERYAFQRGKVPARFVPA